MERVDLRLEAVDGLLLLEHEEVVPLADDDVEPAVDQEGREDRLAERRARERRRRERRDGESAAHAVRLLELLREVLVEEARHDGQFRAQAFGVERDLEVDRVAVRDGEERPRLEEPRLAQDAGIARVADENRRARGLGDAPPFGARVLRDDDRALAEAREELDDTDADVPEAADEDRGGAGRGRRGVRGGAAHRRAAIMRKGPQLPLDGGPPAF